MDFELENDRTETGWTIEYTTWSDGVKQQNYDDEDNAIDAYRKVIENPNTSNVKFFKTETTFYNLKNN